MPWRSITVVPGSEFPSRRDDNQHALREQQDHAQHQHEDDDEATEDVDEVPPNENEAERAERLQQRLQAGKGKRQHLNEDERKEKLRISNRESARRLRQRRLESARKLQGDAERLQRENVALMQRVAELEQQVHDVARAFHEQRRELDTARTELRIVRSTGIINGGLGGNNPGGSGGGSGTGSGYGGGIALSHHGSGGGYDVLAANLIGNTAIAAGGVYNGNAASMQGGSGHGAGGHPSSGNCALIAGSSSHMGASGSGASGSERPLGRGGSNGLARLGHPAGVPSVPLLRDDMYEDVRPLTQSALNRAASDAAQEAAAAAVLAHLSSGPPGPSALRKTTNGSSPPHGGGSGAGHAASNGGGGHAGTAGHAGSGVSSASGLLLPGPRREWERSHERDFEQDHERNHERDHEDHVAGTSSGDHLHHVPVPPMAASALSSPLANSGYGATTNTSAANGAGTASNMLNNALSCPAPIITALLQYLISHEPSLAGLVSNGSSGGAFSSQHHYAEGDYSSPAPLDDPAAKRRRIPGVFQE